MVNNRKNKEKLIFIAIDFLKANNNTSIIERVVRIYDGISTVVKLGDMTERINIRTRQGFIGK